jgi:predicted DNA-binding transcriptional regulator AlpA
MTFQNLLTPAEAARYQNLLNEIEAAAYLKCAVITLQKRRCRGDLPRHIKLGRSVRYRLCDLNAFIESGLRNSTSDDGTANRPAAR